MSYGATSRCRTNPPEDVSDPRLSLPLRGGGLPSFGQFLLTPQGAVIPKR